MTTNIYTEISSNKRKTYIIMFVFVLFISFWGYVGGEYLVSYKSGVSYMTFALFFSTISALFSYYYSDKVILGISGAKKIERKDNEHLYGILENLCIGSGIKKVPNLYIIEDTSPNAFATGRDPDHSSIAVTSGLIEKLDKREIEGVIAHELSHIRNFDIRLMTIVVILVGTVSILANTLLRNFMFGGRSKDNRDEKGGNINQILMILGFVLIIFSPIIAELIKLAVSRKREFLADASAAYITRDPQGLAMALRKISSDKNVLESASNATAHLYIANPFADKKTSNFLANMFSTHPPIEERIKILESM